MNVPDTLRDRLEALSIPKHQRPTGRSGGALLRVLAWLILAAAIAGGAYYAHVNGLISRVASNVRDVAQPAVEVTTLTVRSRDEQALPPILTANGKIVSDHQVAVATKVSGQIVALYFEQGDRVDAGQLLARIEDVAYRARRDEAVAALAKSRATAAFEEFNAARMEELAREQRASDVELNAARRAHREAVAQVQTDEARLEFAEKWLRDCEVLAPIAGVVLERNVEVGDFVAAEGGRGANANAQFGSIADMSKLRVEIDVSELDVARVRRGMPCSIVPDAYKDRRYSGHVMWIDPGANYAKATVQVKVRIDGPDEYLRVDGAAQVQFLSSATSAPAGGAPAKRTLWIPASAVQTRDGASAVFRVESGVLKRSPVTLGRSLGSQVEVLSGLTEGDTIVDAGVEKLADGARIKPPG